MAARRLRLSARPCLAVPAGFDIVPVLYEVPVASADRKPYAAFPPPSAADAPGSSLSSQSITDVELRLPDVESFREIRSACCVSRWMQPMAAPRFKVRVAARRTARRTFTATCPCT
jgi:hypothetical protein